MVEAGDWLAPESSLRFLLSRLPRASATITTLDAEDGRRADHFAWMKQPGRTVRAPLAEGVR